MVVWCGVCGRAAKRNETERNTAPCPFFSCSLSPLCRSIRIMIGGREEERDDATTTTATTPHQTPDKAREGAKALLIHVNQQLLS